MIRLFFFMVMFLPATAKALTVYLKPAEALKLIFHDSEEIISEEKLLSLGQKVTIEKKLGYRISKGVWNFFVARSKGRVDGYALIDNEIGKTEPITFITAILPDGRLKAVEILAYREPIGSEVRERRFLRQFEGKTTSDPIRVGQDIANISGATMSARAIATGVRRHLMIWQALYGKR